MVDIDISDEHSGYFYIETDSYAVYCYCLVVLSTVWSTHAHTRLLWFLLSFKLLGALENDGSDTDVVRRRMELIQVGVMCTYIACVWP